MHRTVLVALTTFLGAALLFAVEPMLGKWLLPALGGSPATWTACLGLYPCLLLAGYTYAHALTRLPRALQGPLHAALALLAAVWALAHLDSGAPELPSLVPVLGVPWLLLERVGVPFALLASTTPLLHAWTSVVGRRTGARLYAASNAGSLTGLLAYPFAIEPWLTVSTQLRLWGLAAAAVSLVLAGIALRFALLRPGGRGALATAGEAPTVRRQLGWMAGAALPSALLLAVTQHLTVDVAATPLLWVVPLAIYLTTYIVAFGRRRTPGGWVILGAWVLGSLGIGISAFQQGAASLGLQLGTTLLALGAGGMLCHGALARDRPATGGLTRYYLAIGVGGAGGALLISVAAPLVLSDYYELELALLAGFALILAESRDGGTIPLSRAQRRLLWVASGLVLPLLVGALAVRSQDALGAGRIVERSRSFLGPLRVVDLPVGRVLTHGRIQHGMQRPGARRREPTQYFARGTALGRVLDAPRAGAGRRIGVVGLGVGTIAAYGRRGDTIRFYELDPRVVELARRDFTFLADSAAAVETVVGDGRLVLAAEAPQAYDVLVLDAFSSDAVPVHLLTREAFAIYLRQLAPGGLLLANVSNRHLRVERAVLGSARALGLASRIVETRGDLARGATPVVWAVLARGEAELVAALGAAPSPPGPAVLFTDQHASLLALLW